MDEQTVNRLDHIVQMSFELKELLDDEGFIDEESESALSRIHDMVVGAKRIALAHIRRAEKTVGVPEGSPARQIHWETITY